MSECLLLCESDCVTVIGWQYVCAVSEYLFAEGIGSRSEYHGLLRSKEQDRGRRGLNLPAGRPAWFWHRLHPDQPLFLNLRFLNEAHGFLKHME